MCWSDWCEEVCKRWSQKPDQEKKVADQEKQISDLKSDLEEKQKAAVKWKEWGEDATAEIKKLKGKISELEENVVDQALDAEWNEYKALTWKDKKAIWAFKAERDAKNTLDGDAEKKSLECNFITLLFGVWYFGCT